MKRTNLLSKIVGFLIMLLAVTLIAETTLAELGDCPYTMAWRFHDESPWSQATSGSRAPIVSGNRVLFSVSKTNYFMHVHCLDTQNGDLIWMHDGNAFAVEGDVVYVIDEPRAGGWSIVYALNIADGSEIWATSLPWPYCHHPKAILADDLIVVVGHEHGWSQETYYYGINKSNGKIEWDEYYRGHVTSSLAYANGKVFASVVYTWGTWMMPYLYAISTGSGKRSWKAETEWEIGTNWGLRNPLAAYGKVYIITPEEDADNILHAFNAEDGGHLWKTSTSAGASSIPKAAHDMIYTCGSSFLSAFDPSGNSVWQASLHGEPGGSPVIVDNKVYVPSDWGIKVFDAITGKPFWKCPEITQGHIAVGGSKLYTAGGAYWTIGKYLHCYHKALGRITKIVDYPERIIINPFNKPGINTSLVYRPKVYVENPTDTAQTFTVKADQPDGVQILNGNTKEITLSPWQEDYVEFEIQFSQIDQLCISQIFRLYDNSQTEIDSKTATACFPLGNIAGIVMESDCQTPISGAMVRATGIIPYDVGTAFSDPMGTYEIIGLASGINYTVTASAEKYYPKTEENVFVQMNQTRIVSFCLEEVKPDIAVSPDSWKPKEELTDGVDSEKTFIITNEGKAVLDIKKIKPPAWINIEGFTSGIIQPGNQETFKAIVNKLGRHEGTIEIESNDEDESPFEIPVDVTVRPNLVILKAGECLPNYSYPTQIKSPAIFFYDKAERKEEDRILKPTEKDKVYINVEIGNKGNCEVKNFNVRFNNLSSEIWEVNVPSVRPKESVTCKTNRKFKSRGDNTLIVKLTYETYIITEEKVEFYVMGQNGYTKMVGKVPYYDQLDTQWCAKYCLFMALKWWEEDKEYTIKPASSEPPPSGDSIKDAEPHLLGLPCYDCPVYCYIPLPSRCQCASLPCDADINKDTAYRMKEIRDKASNMGFIVDWDSSFDRLLSGFKPAPTIDELKDMLDDGTPVICCGKGGGISDEKHAILLVGYDDDNGVFYIHNHTLVNIEGPHYEYQYDYPVLYESFETFWEGGKDGGFDLTGTPKRGYIRVNKQNKSHDYNQSREINDERDGGSNWFATYKPPALAPVSSVYPPKVISQEGTDGVTYVPRNQALQVAIDTAPTGGTIIVEAGVYGCIVINRPGIILELDDAIIQGCSSALVIIASDTTIIGGTFENGTATGSDPGAGILIGMAKDGTPHPVTNIVIRNSTIRNNVEGIHSLNSEVSLENVTFDNNSDYDIYLDGGTLDMQNQPTLSGTHSFFTTGILTFQSDLTILRDGLFLCSGDGTLKFNGTVLNQGTMKLTPGSPNGVVKFDKLTNAGIISLANTAEVTNKLLNVGTIYIGDDTTPGTLKAGVFDQEGESPIKGLGTTICTKNTDNLIEVSGDILLTGTFDPGWSTIRLTSSGVLRDKTHTFYNLDITGSIRTLETDLHVLNNLTIGVTDGPATLDCKNFNVTVDNSVEIGDADSSGLMKATGGTHNLAALTVGSMGKYDNGSNDVTVNIAGAVDIGGATDTGGNAALGSGTVTVLGGIDNDGTLTSTSGALSVAGSLDNTGGEFYHNAGTVIFTDNGVITPDYDATPGNVFKDIIKRGTGTATKLQDSSGSPPDQLIILGALTIESGTIADHDNGSIVIVEGDVLISENASLDLAHTASDLILRPPVTTTLRFNPGVTSTYTDVIKQGLGKLMLETHPLTTRADLKVEAGRFHAGEQNVTVGDELFITQGAEMFMGNGILKVTGATAITGTLATDAKVDGFDTWFRYASYSTGATQPKPQHTFGALTINPGGLYDNDELEVVVNATGLVTNDGTAILGVGSVNFAAGLTNNNTFTSTPDILNVSGGNFTNSGDYKANNGTLILGEGVNDFAHGGNLYHDIIKNGADTTTTTSLDASRTLTMDGRLTVESGTFATDNSDVINIVSADKSGDGGIVINNGAILSLASSSALNAEGDFTNRGTFSGASKATFHLIGSTFTPGDSSYASNLKTSEKVIQVKDSTFKFEGATWTNYGQYQAKSGSTVELNGSAQEIVSIGAKGAYIAFENIKTNNTGTKTFKTEIHISGTFTIAGGATVEDTVIAAIPDKTYTFTNEDAKVVVSGTWTLKGNSALGRITLQGTDDMNKKGKRWTLTLNSSGKVNMDEVNLRDSELITHGGS